MVEEILSFRGESVKKKIKKAVGYLIVPMFMLTTAAAFFFPDIAMALLNLSKGVVTVTADIAATCAVSNGIVQFGNITAGTATTANGVIPMTCTTGVVATVGLDDGTNQNNVATKVTGAAHAVNRAMNDATPNWVGYDLFYDAADQTAFTNAWNNTTDYLTVYFGTMSGVSQGASSDAAGAEWQITNGTITGTAGTLAAAGTAGVSFATVASGNAMTATSSTGGVPTVTSTGAAGGNQSATIAVYGAIPAGQTQAQGNGAYLDFVGVVAQF